MKFAVSSSAFLMTIVWASLAAAQGGGWAVGAGGTIIHTAGLGQPWTQQASGTTENLHNIYFQDASHGWIAGDNGTLLSTDNGGDTWSKHTTPATCHLREICFSDSQNGWLSGGSNLMYRTADGGATWTQLPSSTFYYNGSMSSVVGSHFFDSQRGWMAFFGRPLYETVDGGATWSERSSEQYFVDASFVDQDHIWASGASGLLMHTNDGGSTWQTQTRGSNTISCVDFVNPDCGWIAGESWNTVSHTTDGGLTWTSQGTGMFHVTSAMTFADESHGWIFSAMGDIRYTSDGGTTFSTQASPTSRSISEAIWVVPEPGMFVLLGMGAVGGLVWGWRRVRSFRILVCLIALSVSMVGLVRADGGADIPAVNTVRVGGYTGGISQSNTYGWQFHVNSDISATQLGVWDYGQNGLNFAHEVGLWDGNGQLLASATVPAGTAAASIDDFRYVPISPVALSAGQSYMVGALYSPYGMDPILCATTNLEDVSVVAPASSISLLGMYFANGPSLSYPGTLSALDEGTFGPSFTFVAVPEPGTIVLLGMGVLGGLVWGWRRF